MLIPTSEPFLFQGGKIGCLLIHGFTGAPKEMRWMGEYLSARGYSVLGVRLAGHATCVEDILRVKWQDWIASVEDGYYLLRGLADQVYVVGLSMGGILSLVFSTLKPVTGVVTMSVPYSLPRDPRLALIHLLSTFIPRVRKGPADWHNLEAAKDHIEYPYLPTKGIIQLRDLLIEMQKSLPKITAPVLLIHSRQDGSVSPDHAEKILSKLGSHDKQIFWVEESGHVIPREPDRYLAFKATEEFIQRVSNTV